MNFSSIVILQTLICACCFLLCKIDYQHELYSIYNSILDVMLFQAIFIYYFFISSRSIIVKFIYAWITLTSCLYMLITICYYIMGNEYVLDHYVELWTTSSVIFNSGLIILHIHIKEDKLPFQDIYGGSAIILIGIFNLREQFYFHLHDNSRAMILLYSSLFYPMIIIILYTTGAIAYLIIRMIKRLLSMI
jgi:hypothetical protein